MTDREKYHEDKLVFMEMITEFGIVITRANRTTAEDELTRGLRLTFETKIVNIWVCLAVQIYLDIQNKLRENVGKSFSELADIASSAKTSIIKSMDFHEYSTQKAKEWTQNDEDMAFLTNQVSHHLLGSDPLLDLARKMRRKNIPAPYFFYRQHPWLCGLWKYSIQIGPHSISIEFANAWGPSCLAPNCTTPSRKKSS